MRLGLYFKIIFLSIIFFLIIILLWEIKLFINEYKYIKNNISSFDYRHPIKIFNDLKKQNPKIVKVTNHISEYLIKEDSNFLPFSGISKRETLNCNENGYYSIYQSDRYGFNNIDNSWNNEIIDFALIGDSFVHGACVNYENTITGNFNKLFNYKKTIVNIGFNGTGPLIQFASMKEYLDTYKVKNIIWFFYEGNDLSNLNNEFKNSILKKYIKDNKFRQNLTQNQKKIDRELLTYLGKKYNSASKKNILEANNIYFEAIIKLLKLQRVRDKFSLKYRYSNEITNNFELITSLIKKYSDEKNANLYFVYIPQIERYKRFFFNDKKKEILNIVKKLNIKIYDIDIVLQDHDPLDNYPFRFQGHFNEKGYKKIAENFKIN